MSNNATASGDDPIQLVLEVPNHENLGEVLENLSDASVTVRTEDIRPAGRLEESRVTVDLGILTDKQLSTLELALEMGYYVRPRETDLATLADRLGISKSAVSQRLRTAEMKIIQNAVGEYYG